MRQNNAFLAIVVSALLGTVVATLFTGCEPPAPVGNKPRGGGKTTDSTPSAPVQVEPAVKPEPKPDEDKKPEPKPEPTPEPTPETKPEPKPEATKEPDQVAVAAAFVPEGKPIGGKYNRQEAGNPVFKVGDWNQWGGNSLRNNVPEITKPAPLDWAPGEFDRKDGKWIHETAKNIKWVCTLGSQTYGNTVVASGRVFAGTNNSNGYIKRYPGDVDLGCLQCFDEKTGKFMWQASSEKLPTGRVHDWPLQGVCCSPYVEGDRVWYVTSRGEVRCLDVQGFYDDEDDGPVTKELGRLFDVMKAEDPAADKVVPAAKELDEGKLPEALRPMFATAGEKLPDAVEVTVATAGKKWTFTAETNGAKRDFVIMLAGPKMSSFKILGPADKDEADTMWVFDMMQKLGTSQHNMCSCSVTAWGDILFVNTSNGVDESHLVVPSPDAPSFIALDKNTGELLWQDNTPKDNVLHGQWGSPAVGILGGVPQVIFGGGDGWVYSFKADRGTDGKPELLWKFDANPKKAILELGGRGTRNDIISTPVIYDGKVYFATGQDPEHGEGSGILWCLNPTKRGDVSEELAVNRADPKKPLPVKRIQAVVEEDGDLAIANPNSAVLWKYEQQNRNGDKKIDFDEQFHRSISTVAIKNDLLFVADFSGLFHCVDAQTGECYWTYDMLAASWGSTMIAGDHVYVGDEDGDIVVFKVDKEKPDAPVAEINMLNSVYSTPIIANGVLYIANKDHIFAIEEGAKPETAEVSATDK